MSKKYFSSNVKNVLATSVIATAFAFGSGQAFANEEQPLENQLVEEKELENVTTSEEQPVVDESTTVENTTEGTEETITNESDEATSEDEGEKEENIDTEETADEPSLLPGDFFYFMKKLMENVQLALTFDDVKESELLASFAEERIAEAKILLENGDEELASELLEKASEQQELALEKYKEEQEAAQVVEGTDNAEGIASEDTAFETKFAANILALQAVLEKIENPKAKEAIAKNIEKAQEKLDKKVNKKARKTSKKS